MKITNILAIKALLLFLTAFSYAQVDISTLSPCTLSCLLQTFPAAGCELTNTTCQCENKSLRDDTGRCMLANCTLTDSLALGKLQTQLCGFPPESKERQMIIVALIASPLALLSIVLRLGSRLLVSKRLWSDDIVISVVGLLLIPFMAMATWMITHGLGTHTWDHSEWEVMRLFRIFYVDELFYILILLLTKVSILLFYIRVFPTTGFQYCAKTLLGFVVLSGVIVLFCVIFQCLPIRFNWDKSVDGKCLHVNALSYAHAGLNIFQDVLILALPVPWILRLTKLSLRQKVGLIVMFQLGTFACVTAAVRLRFLFQFGGTNSIDPLWDNSSATIWTSAETSSAIICACLPAMRALYKTSKRFATEHSSKRKSITLLSIPRSDGGDNVSYSNMNRPSRAQSAAAEFHHDLVEQWEQKDAEAAHRHAPITITSTDLGSSFRQHPFMPELREEPENDIGPSQGMPKSHTATATWTSTRSPARR